MPACVVQLTFTPPKQTDPTGHSLHGKHDAQFALFAGLTYDPCWHVYTAALSVVHPIGAPNALVVTVP